jgi:muconolactone delta-isomerase
MQFLFSGKATMEVQANPPADLMDQVRADWAMVRDYYNQGIFRQIWMAGYGVIAICEAASREEIDAYLAKLPMMKAGYIDVELQEITPYAGFAPEPTGN